MRRTSILIVIALGLSLFAGYGTFLIQQKADQRALNAMTPILAYRATQSIPERTSLRVALAQKWIEATQFPKNLIGDNSLQEVNMGNLDLVTLIPISKGQLIYRSFIGNPRVSATTLSIPDNYSAVSLNLTSEARVGGYLNPGDYVDVMGTSKNMNNVPSTQLLLSRIRVLAIGKSAVNGLTINDTGATLQNLVTIALKSSQIPILLSAAASGNISLVLLPSTTRDLTSDLNPKISMP